MLNSLYFARFTYISPLLCDFTLDKKIEFTVRQNGYDLQIETNSMTGQLFNRFVILILLS